MTTPASIADRELVLTRIIDVPADKLFKCWTTPERLHEWFCPKPWTVSRAEMAGEQARTALSSVEDHLSQSQSASRRELRQHAIRKVDGGW